MYPRSFAFTRRTALLAAAGALAPLLEARAATGVKPATPAETRPTAWPIASPVPGGIARLALGPSTTRPQAFAGEVPLLVLGDARGWTAIVGIPLSATPGPAQIAVRAAGGERALGYDIRPKRYVEQRLTVSPRTVDLAPEDLALVRGEDSFVRAQLVGHGPVLWQIYPQSDGAHGPKLDAWMDRLLVGSPPTLAAAVRRIQRVVNGLDSAVASQPPAVPDLADWATQQRRWQAGLHGQDDLARQLQAFVAARLAEKSG